MPRRKYASWIHIPAGRRGNVPETQRHVIASPTQCIVWKWDSSWHSSPHSEIRLPSPPPLSIKVCAQTCIYNHYGVSNLQRISKQTEIVLRESFFRNAFCSALEDLYSNSISKGQVCFEATVVIVIYYREAKKPKVCKHSFRLEETGSKDPPTHTHRHTRGPEHSRRLPVWFRIYFLHHNLLSYVYRVLSLNNRCIRKWSISTTVKVHELITIMNVHPRARVCLRVHGPAFGARVGQRTPAHEKALLTSSPSCHHTLLLCAAMGF